MALIKCPECGQEISRTLSACPKCGFVFPKKKKSMKIIIVLAGVVIAIALVIFLITKLFFLVAGPGSKAIKIIEKDLGSSIEVINVYYNKEEQGCVVKFYWNNTRDTACVHLDEKKVGYKSVSERYTALVNNAITDEDKQKYAKQAADYQLNVYNAVWVYNSVVNGSKNEKSSWKKIK